MTPRPILTFALVLAHATSVAAPTYQGSWNTPIKNSDTDAANRSSCDASVGWSHDDPATMVDALLDGSQNLTFGYMSNLTTTSCQWQSFESMATAAVGTGIDVGGQFPDDFSLSEYAASVY